MEVPDLPPPVLITEYSNRPGWDSVGGGLPDSEAMPKLDDLHRAIDRLGQEGLNEAMQYQAIQGYAPARRATTEYLTHQFSHELESNHAEGKWEVAENEVMLMPGSNKMFTVWAEENFKPEDLVITGMPDFMCALPVFGRYIRNCLAVRLLEDGYDTNAMMDRASKWRNSNKGDIYFYKQDRGHNPTGATGSLENNRELAEIVKFLNIHVVEDMPYKLHDYDGNPIPSLFSLLKGENVIYVESLSKTFGVPGGRIAVVAADEKEIRAIGMAQARSDLTPNSFAQAVLMYALENGGERLLSNVARMNKIYRQRRDAGVEEFDKLKQEGLVKEYRSPRTGFYFYPTFVDGVDTDEMFRYLFQQQKLILPATGFDPRKYISNVDVPYEVDTRHSARISLSHISEPKFREMIRAMGDYARMQVR